MISAFTNIFRIPELRSRILFTFALLIVVRVGAFITCPGVNASVLQHWFDNQLNTQSGGSTYYQRAIFFPRGLAGRIYWLSILPFHGIIFSGMARRIVAAAESRTHTSPLVAS
jgi:hypothetical protein